MDLSQLDYIYKWRRTAAGLDEEEPQQEMCKLFHLPSDPIEVFNWICDQNLPRLEDETPPWDFYEEELEADEVELGHGCCGKLVVSLGSQTQAPEEPDVESSEETDDDMVSVMSQPPAELVAPEEPPKAEKSTWSGLVKKAVLAVSLIHSAYVLGTACVRGLGSFNFSLSAMRTPMVNQEAPCSMPVCLWRQVAAKLSIHGYQR